MGDYTILNDVPAALCVVPLQRVEARLGCSNRTLVKRLVELEIPITQVSYNTRGLIIPDLERLVSHCRRRAAAQSVAR